jgi:hypothetical protein
VFLGDGHDKLDCFYINSSGDWHSYKSDSRNICSHLLQKPSTSGDCVPNPTFIGLHSYKYRSNHIVTLGLAQWKALWKSIV